MSKPDIWTSSVPPYYLVISDHKRAPFVFEQNVEQASDEVFARIANEVWDGEDIIAIHKNTPPAGHTHGRCDDETTRMAQWLAQMSFDKSQRPREELADWLADQGCTYFGAADDYAYSFSEDLAKARRCEAEAA